MRLVIDICEEEYEHVLFNIEQAKKNNKCINLVSLALANGTPLSDSEFPNKSVLEDIRTEINELYTNARKADICEQMGLKIALDVIDKYTAQEGESE